MKKIILFLLLMLLFGCEDNKGEDIKVTVVNTFTSSIGNRSWAQVRYSIKNTGSTTVNGWEIYFTVSLNSGPNYTASANENYTIEPGETYPSSLGIASVEIPFGKTASNASFASIDLR